MAPGFAPLLVALAPRDPAEAVPPAICSTKHATPQAQQGRGSQMEMNPNQITLKAEQVIHCLVTQHLQVASKPRHHSLLGPVASQTYPFY